MSIRSQKIAIFRGQKLDDHISEKKNTALISLRIVRSNNINGPDKYPIFSDFENLTLFFDLNTPIIMCIIKFSLRLHFDWTFSAPSPRGLTLGGLNVRYRRSDFTVTFTCCYALNINVTSDEFQIRDSEANANLHGFGNLDEGFYMLLNGQETGSFILGTMQKVEVKWQLDIPGKQSNIKILRRSLIRLAQESKKNRKSFYVFCLRIYLMIRFEVVPQFTLRFWKTLSETLKY